MRYFKTGNASRPYHVGGQAIYFESVHRNGAGALRGIYATDSGQLASLLAKHGPPIHEIGEEEYQTEKKKATNSSPQSNFKPAGPQLRSAPPKTATPVAEPQSAKDAKEPAKNKVADDLIIEDLDVPGLDKPKVEKPVAAGRRGKSKQAE